MHKDKIFKPLALHIDDFQLLKACTPLIAVALADNFFPTVLLKMVGGFEQKVKETAWQIGNIDTEFRRGITTDNAKDGFRFKDSLKTEDVYTLYNHTLKILNSEITFDKNEIEKDATIFKNTYSWIQDKFISLDFIHSSYKNHWDCFSSNKIFSNSNNSISGFNLKKLLSDAIKARHSFAHYTFSFQSRSSSLSELTDSRHAENYFMHFFVLIYADTCLMAQMEKVMKNHRRKMPI